MDYRARDTTQSDFGIGYAALCQQANKFDRAVEECNRRLSNSRLELELIESQLNCNLSEARMRLEEQTVEHYVPGFNSPFVTRQSVMKICEDEQKSCTNCKWNLCYPTYKWCGADLEDPIRSCIRSGRKYWRKSKLLDNQDHEQSVHDEVEYLKDRINQTRYEKFSSELSDVYIKVMDADKPKKKYTIYDLYDLTFPDDPIKKHFITVCNNIEKRYQERKEVLDQIEAPEVRTHHVEPIPTVTIDDDPVLNTIVIVILVALSFAIIFAFCELAYFVFSLV